MNFLDILVHMRKLTDSHFHLLHLKRNSFDISTLNLSYGIDIGTECDDLDKRLPLLNTLPHIDYSLGVGPWGLKSEKSISDQISIIEENIKRSNPIAIGEIGLDYYWNYGTPELQKELFLKQIELANKYSLSVLVHTRDAIKDTITILNETEFKKPGVMHCFSGDETLLEAALKNGFYISFAGNITYKSNDMLRNCLKQVPKERLLLETDAPYLAPVPKRGRENNPNFIEYTYKFVSEYLEMDEDELIDLIEANYRFLFNKE